MWEFLSQLVRQIKISKKGSSVKNHDSGEPAIVITITMSGLATILVILLGCYSKDLFISPQYDESSPTSIVEEDTSCQPKQIGS